MASNSKEAVFLRVLQGCNSMSRLRRIHAQVLVQGCHHHPAVSAKLLSFCATSAAGDPSYARLLFSSLPPSVATTDHWNALIRSSSSSLAAVAPHESISLYNAMLSSSSPSRPDAFTFCFLLKACALVGAGAGAKCLEAHASVVRVGFSSHVAVCTSLVRCYAENGAIEDAGRLFDEMPEKDLVSWNSMISSYCRAGLHDEALRVYDRMRTAAVGLDEYTVVALLASCAHVGALEFGIRIHDFAEENGFLDRNVFVGNALIDMYAKCGNLDRARQVFSSMPRRDRFTWNSMIIGFGVHGCADEAISFYQEMLEAGVRPNSISFVGLLMACSHRGLIDEGLKYFHLMRFYNIKQDGKHYGCIVDMLGRAGKLVEAFDMIKDSPCSKDPVLWRTLLSASKIHGNVEMGEISLQNLIELSAYHAGDCALLSDIYEKTGDTEGVSRMRKMVKDQKIKTVPGWSWIEIQGKMRKFVVGDASHPESGSIHEKLREMITRAVTLGYDSKRSDVTQKDDSAVQQVEEYHSELLAIALGLISSPEGMPLRIVKNLRVCKDCHSLTKFMSRIYNREIIVRDRARFHHFKNGLCSCNDYW